MRLQVPMEKLMWSNDRTDGSSFSGIARKSRNALKRILDLLISVCLLVFTAPLMLLVAIVITCESNGPALYRQERVGSKGSRFTLLKFRSMNEDAEPESKPVWASPGDSRVTRVGRFIRYTRIDELPQLFNVLRGEMSMVGPRPERPYFVDQLTELVPSYAERHNVKPGITGWAQVNYPYGASIEDARRKLEYDLHYVNHINTRLDLRILCATVGVVILGKGAR